MKKIVLWGTGNIANYVIMNCNIGEEYYIIGVIDNDVSKQGSEFYGSIIYPPNYLTELEQEIDNIIILANAYNEIYNQIIEINEKFKDIIEDRNYFFKQTIIKRYSDSCDREILQTLDFIKKNRLQIFNYDFVDKYRDFKYDIYKDENCGLYYLYHNGRKLFFSRNYDTKEQVSEYYKSICIEQDANSPHRYLNENFNIRDGAIVIDVGAAEGFFSLDIIEKAKKIYVIESDEGWIEALHHTFREYSEKVCIIQKYITSYDDGNYTKLDSIISEPVDFIKMDIEGNEWDALKGAERIIRESGDIDMAVCCYHSDFDQTLIEHQMDVMNIKHTTSHGYMWYPYTNRQTYISTQLNRAIVRGSRRV